MTERSVPVLEGRGLVKTFGTRQRAAGRRLHRRRRHGDGADRRQRRRQVDAGQGAVGRAPSRRRHDPARRRAGVVPLAARRPPPGHRDRLPGPRPRAAPRRRRQRVPRAGDPPGRRVHQQAGDAPAHDGRVPRPRGDDGAGPAVPVPSLSGGQRQSVAIARSALWAKRVIFFDEPTAALGVVQTRRVLDLIRRVRDQGLGVVLITHTLPDVLEVADRVEVLRFGRRSAHFERADATIELLVAAITGAYTQRRDPGGERTMTEPSVDALAPADDADPPTSPIDETVGAAVGRSRRRSPRSAWPARPHRVDRLALHAGGVRRRGGVLLDHRRRPLPHHHQPDPHRPERRRADRGGVRERRSC